MSSLDVAPDALRGGHDTDAEMAAPATDRESAALKLTYDEQDGSGPAAGPIPEPENEHADGAQPPEEPVVDMASSVATVKPKNPRIEQLNDSDSPPPKTPRQQPDRGGGGDSIGLRPIPYVDPTPPTPSTSQPPSRSSSNPRVRLASSSAEASPIRSEYDDEDDDKRYPASEDDHDGDGDNDGASRSEIQSIMGQFDEDGGGPGEEEVMSPRLEIASPGGILAHPPRTSSLDGGGGGGGGGGASSSQVFVRSPPSSSSSPISLRSARQPSVDDQAPPVPLKDHPYHHSSHHQDGTAAVFAQAGAATTPEEVAIPLSPLAHRPPPPPLPLLPEPEPEPSLPFDFHRFLEQLRNKKADPVARYLKSFLSEFSKRQWMVHEQVKIISDFLAFIAAKMAQCDVWRDVSDPEFDNAREGMEKLVMNRLYSQTFSPAIPPPQPIPGAKARRRGGERPMGPGRRGQHQEDVERDDVLAQKIKIYGWVREQHLDIAPVGDSGKRFLKLAQQELLKIRAYRAPRDKIICVLNCCKVIFGLLRHSKSDTSADSFMPLLIYVVLQANPEHLVSNVQYILRFRNQDRLGGEAGYYLSSLLGAIQFVENMDRTTLTITDDEFERNVEAAVSAIAEKHNRDEHATATAAAAAAQQQNWHQNQHRQLRPLSEKAPVYRTAASQSGEGESSSTPRQPTPSGELSGGDSSSDEKAPMAGLLRSIQRPLSSIGRMITEEITGTLSATPPPHNPYQNATQAGSPNMAPPPPPTPTPSHRPPGGAQTSPDQHQRAGRPPPPYGTRQPPPSHHHRLSAEEAAARQASAEAAEAQRLQRAEHANVVETLAGMFPDLDRDVISDVVYQKEGRVGLAVDACLALST